MKIHFVSFFGVDFDLDLFPFWSKWYKEAGFDSYHIILHREKGEINEEIRARVRDVGFSYSTVSGPYASGIGQAEHLEEYVRKLPRGDFLVVADADEFQSVPAPTPSVFESPEPDIIVHKRDEIPPHIDYRSILSESDIIMGWMTDRYTTRLETCFKTPFEQFPYEEPLTKEILKNFTPYWLKGTQWPLTRRTKVLASRIGYPIAFEGSHCMREVPSNAKIVNDYRVYHFAWRESTRKKIIMKTYYSRDNAQEINEGKADFTERFDEENMRKGMGYVENPSLQNL